MYKSLEIVSYENYYGYEEEYQKRVNALSAFKTNLAIHPFSKKKQKREIESYNLFYIPLAEHMMQLEKIYQKSQRLNFLMNQLPSLLVNNLVISQIFDEIQSTNEIEGVKSTRREINEAYAFPEKNKRFSGIVKMYESIFKNDFEKIESLSDYREIYDKIFLDEIPDSDKPDGELFRTGLVFVSGGNKYVHQGDVSEAAINDDLTKLIIFMNNDQCPSLVKAIITHYFFEYVHPFYDGNGRMGRFLFSSYVARKTDLLTGISLSEVINQNRKEYEEAFPQVSHPRNRGEITIFIGKLLKLIENGQKNMLFKLDKLNSQVGILNERIKNLGLSEIEMNLLFVLAQNELFDLSHHQLSNKNLLEILKNEKYARTKLDKAMKELESKGYVTKIKKSPVTYKLAIDFFED